MGGSVEGGGVDIFLNGGKGFRSLFGGGRGGGGRIDLDSKFRTFPWIFKLILSRAGSSCSQNEV